MGFVVGFPVQLAPVAKILAEICCNKPGELILWYQWNVSVFGPKYCALSPCELACHTGRYIVIHISCRDVERACVVSRDPRTLRELKWCHGQHHRAHDCARMYHNFHCPRYADNIILCLCEKFAYSSASSRQKNILCMQLCCRSSGLGRILNIHAPASLLVKLVLFVFFIEHTLGVPKVLLHAIYEHTPP